MLKSKKGHLASEVLGYRVIDRYSKKMGKVVDLLLNSNSHIIDYIMVGKRWVIPVSFINSDDSTKKEIMVSQTKDRIKHALSQKTDFPPEKSYNFSDLRSSVVYDIAGSELGYVSDIAYHPGLKIDFLVRKEGARFLFPNFYVIPSVCVGQFHKKSVVLGVVKDEFDLVNFTGFQHLFLPYQMHEDTKRYVIVEAPVTTVSHYLSQREEAQEKASESESLFVEELDVSKDIKVRQFVKLFNLVLVTSPDTYVPLSDEDARKYFRHGTFIAIEYYKPIGYCCVTIEKQEETSQNSQHIGVIAGIGVHPSCRGRNISTALINQSLRYMIDNDVDKIQADIYESNTASLRLFSSLGFREVGETFLV